MVLGIVVLGVLLGCTVLKRPLTYLAWGISWGVAGHEWERSGFESHPPTDKAQIDRTFHFAKCIRHDSFSDLFVHHFFHEHGSNGVLRAGRPLGEYIPQADHRYYCYRFLGRMPVDVVCDHEDKVLLIYPSFSQ